MLRGWYRNQVFNHQGFLEASYIGGSTQAISFQYCRLGETGMYSIGDGMQEIHLIGRKVFGLLNKQRLAGIQQPVYSIFQVLFCCYRIILYTQPYKPCQLLYIRRIPICYLTDFSSQLFRDMLAGRFETLTDILHPVFLAYLVQIEEISKAIKWVTGIQEHLFHHMFLAAIKTVRYMAL